MTALAQNTNAQFIGIRNRSNDVIHHSDVNFLRIFSKWYNEEYLDEEITEDLEEVFTERRYAQVKKVRNNKNNDHFLLI